jgi:hypothetical protein
MAAKKFCTTAKLLVHDMVNGDHAQDVEMRNLSLQEARGIFFYSIRLYRIKNDCRKSAEEAWRQPKRLVDQAIAAGR